MKRKRENVADTEPVVPEWKPERQILTASEVEDKESYKTEGSIELRIDRFADFVREEEVRYSAPTYIRGLSWEIQANCEETDESDNQDGQPPSKVLSFFLWCQRDSTNRPWECHANFSLRVIAQTEGVNDIVRENLEDTFYGKDNWGFTNFATCDLLAMDSEYFKEQFSKCEDNNRAVLQDVGYGEFIELLSVIYPISCPITAGNVETISKLAFKFNMAALLRQCEILLMKKK
ncbi:BTB/POZ domain-containing protein [Ditylenchus destructor]|uniref:BTB/POZ domain-containing protein n=1 Tax=Ditylenchus destructor TaxID=166010 RepID=A0AAD4QW29_9BILA|nr:BTB/POZ domain-containing protein [Ditylenchus destructor]